ncbi:UNKNOWN [Stylonychia lemnae]|uniref:Amino acid transporter transmembrane domain-containing protein n=1 Tax=Stylonychia lemnae TaxID=5949 RepID=A0A078ARF8_STYLE|nr:UNKNOWN [Stylonychia lemnae]|eukprot:CDW85040.1 UNKNOWN [Stylonychia lemnae]
MDKNHQPYSSRKPQPRRVSKKVYSDLISDDIDGLRDPLISRDLLDYNQNPSVKSKDTSRSFVKCDELTGKFAYESLAKIAFGRRWKPFVSLMMLICVVYPLSIPTEINQTMVMSAIGAICSIFTVFVIVYEFLADRLVVPDISGQFQHIKYFILDWDRFVESTPFVVFLYMYQGIIPQMYRELDRRNLNRMDRIILRSSIGTVFIYLIIGIFGYLTFVDKIQEQILDPKRNGNILECDYQGSKLVQLARASVTFSLIATVPLCLIPAKDSYMQMVGIRELNDENNSKLSIGLVLVTYIATVAIPNIRGAITLLGATVNPFIGFIFPIMFYLKLDPQPLASKDKIIAILVMIFIIFASILGLLQYFLKEV